MSSSSTECKITRVDGEPGSGKTTFIGNSPDYHTVVCATNAAAENGRRRFPEMEWTTIHKLVYPHAKHLAKSEKYYRKKEPIYNREPIINKNDPALSLMVKKAPGRQPIGIAQLMEEDLLKWREGLLP